MVSWAQPFLSVQHWQFLSIVNNNVLKLYLISQNYNRKPENSQTSEVCQNVTLPSRRGSFKLKVPGQPGELSCVFQPLQYTVWASWSLWDCPGTNVWEESSDSCCKFYSLALTCSSWDWPAVASTLRTCCIWVGHSRQPTRSTQALKMESIHTPPSPLTITTRKRTDRVLIS